MPEPYPLPDKEYLRYGEDGANKLVIRSAYLQTTLEISDRERAGTAVYLLYPQIVTPEGAWEAWFFAHWIAGANRFRSLWELMQHEHQGFLRLRQEPT